MKKQRRNNFTLLEVMVCIALLAMLAGAFAWKGHDLLQHYLLRSSAKTIVQEIEAAHTLALSYQTDVAVTIVKEQGTWLVRWETDEPRLRYRCKPCILRGVKNALVDYKKNKRSKIADFSSSSAASCQRIDLEGKSESCRIELRQGRPCKVKTIHHDEEE